MKELSHVFLTDWNKNIWKYNQYPEYDVLWGRVTEQPELLWELLCLSDSIPQLPVFWHTLWKSKWTHVLYLFELSSNVYMKNNFISQKKLWDCTKLYIKINFYFRFHVLNLKICVWLWFFLDIEKDRKVRSRAEPDCVCPKRSHVGGSSGAGTENSKWGTFRALHI